MLGAIYFWVKLLLGFTLLIVCGVVLIGLGYFLDGDLAKLGTGLLGTLLGILLVENARLEMRIDQLERRLPAPPDGAGPPPNT